MPKGYTYILQCADGSFYTGSTIDPERRLFQHQQGIGANYTAKRLPVILVYLKEYKHIALAFRREKQIQNWSHSKKKALIAGNDKELHELAECRN
ncbi:MAG: GIY-YIG nuclease family protein, partial [Flavobacteriales bacterium]|nr:GIY-YIG nuclease family protein [Flavobacteriales bacterium]